MKNHTVFAVVFMMITTVDLFCATSLPETASTEYSRASTPPSQQDSPLIMRCCAASLLLDFQRAQPARSTSFATISTRYTSEGIDPTAPALLTLYVGDLRETTPAHNMAAYLAQTERDINNMERLLMAEKEKRHNLATTLRAAQQRAEELEKQLEAAQKMLGATQQDT